MNLTTVLFLGAGQAAFLTALIAGKRSKTLSDGVLAAWLVVLGLHHLAYALHHQGIDLESTLLNVNAGVPLLQGPFLFLYVSTLTSGRRRMRAADALHLLPFFAFAGYISLFPPRSAHATASSVSVFQLSSAITAAILVSVPAYAFVALRRLRRHRADTLDRYSERRGRDLSWLRGIVLALLAVWSVVIALVLLTTLVPSSVRPGAGHQMMGAVTLFIYAIGYFGWRQFAVVDQPAFDATDGAPGPPSGATAKYERSGLKKAEVEALVERLDAHLEEERPYLEPGVTLKEIAANLETTSNHLSQAINQGLEKNFYELINQRRVQAFKRMALEPRNEHRNLLAIAYDAGFSSKSSFNRVFKQVAGMSPRQYVESRVHSQTEEGPPPT